MNRRSFLKHGSLLASSLATTRRFAHAPEARAREQFSLHVLTDASDRAIAAMEELIKTSFANSTRVKFAEYQLAGRHLGDLVVIKNQSVVDYRQAHDAFALQARALAKNLQLPRVMENPVLVKFYTDTQSTQAQNALVFVNNVLVQQLPFGAQAETHEITGLRGRMAIALRNGSVKVAGTSCRHKTCMKMGAINAPGQHLICIPNAVRIAIEGQNENGLDGVTF
ncbi:NusG domain II-containing protein [candidate division KSB1 bacterium]|nr:NusG domain II-containing protein [candidate division KSB1 bacterium]